MIPGDSVRWSWPRVLLGLCLAAVLIVAALLAWPRPRERGAPPPAVGSSLPPRPTGRLAPLPDPARQVEVSDHGRFTLAPVDPLLAGSFTTLNLHFQVGPRGLSVGEGVRVELPYVHAYSGWSPLQWQDPRGEGWVHLLSGSRARFHLRRQEGLHPALLVTLEGGGPLRSGDWVRLILGDRSRGGPGMRVMGYAGSTRTPGFKPFRLVCIRGAEDLDDGSLYLEVLPAAPARVQIFWPATPALNEVVTVILLAEDRFGNPVVLDHPPELFLQPGVQRVGGPRPSATPGLYLAQVKLTDRAPHWLRARAHWRAGTPGTDVAITGVSDPAQAGFLGTERIYFGDLHAHGGLSPDEVGTPETVHRWAREVYRLDFLAVTDHDFSLDEARWQEVQARSRRWTEAGRFVSLLGFEWTRAFSFGHRTVIFPGTTGRLVRSDRPAGDTPEELWRVVGHRGAMTNPHLPLPAPAHHQADWSRHHPSQRLVEIFSQWVALGQEIETTPNGVREGLARGHRLGIYASSDNHGGRPGQTGGLAAVQADRLDRREVFQALWRRRCYGVTGARILLDLRATDRRRVRTPDGSGTAAAAQMGGELRSDGALHLRIRAVGRRPLSRLELFRFESGAYRLAQEVRPGREVVDLTLELPPFRRPGFVYLRLTQVDGARAWSSPIWVDPRGG